MIYLLNKPFRHCAIKKISIIKMICSRAAIKIYSVVLI